MKITYDPQVDCGYIFLREPDPDPLRDVRRTIVLKIAPEDIFGELVADLNEHGHIIGIEVLGVSTIMPDLIGHATSQE